MSAREELILAGATPEQIDDYARELAEKIRDPENWTRFQLAKSTLGIYMSVARKSAWLIDPDRDPQGMLPWRNCHEKTQPHSAHEYELNNIRYICRTQKEER